MSRRVFVAGVGLTRVGRNYTKGLVDLAAEAARKAVEESGLTPQALIVSNLLGQLLDKQSLLASKIASSMGLRYRYAVRVEAGQASGAHAVIAGYTLVASGLYDSVLVVGVEKMTDYPSATVTASLSTTLDSEYQAMYGLTPASYAGLQMRYYMEKYGVTRDELSEWPVLMHANAAENPYAQFRRPITKESVAKSQVVADPVRVLDTSPVGDGAAAVVLAAEEALREAQPRGTDPVEIVGVAGASDAVATMLSELDRLPSVALAFRAALRRARVDPKEIGVAEIHDEYTITAMLVIEEMGYADRGKAAKLLAEGRFRPGDKPTLNPSGGLKARGHPVGATGVYQTAEVAMQLRGDFPGVKASDTEVGAVVSSTPQAASTAVIVLRRT